MNILDIILFIGVVFEFVCLCIVEDSRQKLIAKNEELKDALSRIRKRPK